MRCLIGDSCGVCCTKLRCFVPESTDKINWSKGYWMIALFTGGLGVSLLMKGKSQSTTNRSITRQKPDDTLLWQVVVKLVAAKARANSKFLIPASDGCSTSHMKPQKSARLTQLNAQDPRDTREDNARTAEITICIISERTVRSLSTVTVRLESQAVEDNVHCVTVWVSNVLLMVVYRNSDTEPIQEINTTRFLQTLKLIPPTIGNRANRP